MKKFFKVLLIVLFIMFVFYLVVTFKNYIIISEINEKFAKYKDSDNYHINYINEQENGNIIETDYYKKGNKEVAITKNGSTTMAFYNNGERVDMFVDGENGDKIAKIGGSDVILPTVHLVNIFENDSKIKTFGLSSLVLISKGTVDGKECYVLENVYSANVLEVTGSKTKYAFDKETGLCIKEENDSFKVTKKYEFDNVDDSVFVEPNIGEYMIVKD